MLKPLPIIIIAIVTLGAFQLLSFFEIEQPLSSQSSLTEKPSPSPIKQVLQESTQDDIIAEDLSQAPESNVSVTPSSNQVSGNIPRLSLKVRVKPEFQNGYILNNVVVNATGVSGGGGSGNNPGEGNNGPVNPEATCPATGPITCGTLAGGCHCSSSYQASACNGFCDYCQAPNDGAKYAIDITNPLDGAVYVPEISINGEAHSLTCIGAGDFTGSREPGQVIHVLSCVDDTTDEPVWLQFHHNKNDESVTGKPYISGDIVGHSAAFVSFDSGPHVHLQMGIGGPCGYNGVESCVDPTEYLQCS